MEPIYQELKNTVQIDYIANSRGTPPSVHYHDAYEIYLLEKGQRTYIIDGTFIELEPYDVALIKPYELHSTDGGLYNRYLLYFKEEYLGRFFTEEAKKKLLTFFNKKKLTLEKDTYEQAKELLLMLRADTDNFIIFCQIIKLFLDCCDGEESIKVSAKKRLISRIVEYLSENFTGIKNLDELAGQFYITKHYLCRLFKKETGVSVVTYINTHKMQLACEKLHFTKKSVEEVAIECGFNSSMYFCKIFKKNMGVTPGEYRKLKQI